MFSSKVVVQLKAQWKAYATRLNRARWFGFVDKIPLYGDHAGCACLTRSWVFQVFAVLLKFFIWQIWQAHLSNPKPWLARRKSKLHSMTRYEFSFDWNRATEDCTRMPEQTSRSATIEYDSCKRYGILRESI